MWQMTWKASLSVVVAGRRRRLGLLVAHSLPVGQPEQAAWCV